VNEPRVEIVDLGTWGAAALFAEYDPEDDVIRVNARIVECMHAARGAAEAARFVACAIAHERYHRTYPSASEEGARRYAAAVSGLDSDCEQLLLRAAAQSPAGRQ